MDSTIINKVKRLIYLCDGSNELELKALAWSILEDVVPKIEWSFDSHRLHWTSVSLGTPTISLCSKGLFHLFIDGRFYGHCDTLVAAQSAYHKFITEKQYAK